ncbi:hypothetical protein PINS_up001748 [Pythium insidiosum]|nr:hypothetical protein PINS_up001748 [Pythium insidiosum]
MPPAPADHEVRRLFEELLRSKNVAAVVLEELLVAESTETQWMYLCLYVCLIVKVNTLSLGD